MTDTTATPKRGDSDDRDDVDDRLTGRGGATDEAEQKARQYLSGPETDEKAPPPSPPFE